MTGAGSEWVQKVWIAFFLTAVAAAGFFVAGVYASIIDLTWRARSWEQVDAELMSWDLGKNRKGFSTSEVIAEYAWSHGGESHRSSRVAVVSLRNSLSGEIKAAAKSKFIEASRAGGLMKIWMDPKNPRESLVVRSLPVSWAAFASVFLLAPCGVASAFFLGWLSGRMDKMGRRGWMVGRWGSIWMMLHGLVPIPALWLADFESLIGWSGFFLILVFLLFPWGAWRFFRGEKTPEPARL